MSAVLGISAYHGDAAAALVVDGRLVAAIEEERFTRIKHCAGFPHRAVRACLDMAGLRAAEIDHFAIGRDPRAHVLRKALFTLGRRPSLALLTDRAKSSSRVRQAPRAIAETLELEPRRVARRTDWVEHHRAHLASAFLVSPFDTAAICAVDGFGDFVSASWAIGDGTTLDIVRRVYFPHSLGLLYLAITQYLGFHEYGDEYKVMGLAPYGEPDHADRIRRLLHLTPDGGFELDLTFFRHSTQGVSMTWEAGRPTIEPVYTPELEALLGPARDPAEPLAPRHEAVAASLQLVFEEAVFHVLNALHRATRSRRLCLAGGCAMNSVANGKIRERTPFEDVYVQAAAGDDGTALGAAFDVWHRRSGAPRRFVMEHAGWGPEFSPAEIRAILHRRTDELGRQGCEVREIADDDELTRWTAERIADGKIVGWVQGRMEWGARALGNRSILADPRRADMRDVINARIKFREKFRPFAPSILEEAVDEYFAGASRDPFMMHVHAVRPEKRASIPAVVHVDGSARLQTVSQQSQPLYWQLLKAFAKLTGVPVLLNTSFNENEPIVHTPDEALDCYLRTRMDVLVLGRATVAKEPRG
jgi:carbamoyltransferase